MRIACAQEIDQTERAARKLGLTMAMVHVASPEQLDEGFRSSIHK